MGILSRLLEKIDDNLTHTIELHIARAIPAPRDAEPDQAVVRRLRPEHDQPEDVA